MCTNLSDIKYSVYEGREVTVTSHRYLSLTVTYHLYFFLLANNNSKHYKRSFSQDLANGGVLPISLLWSHVWCDILGAVAEFLTFSEPRTRYALVEITQSSEDFCLAALSILETLFPFDIKSISPKREMSCVMSNESIPLHSWIEKP